MEESVNGTREALGRLGAWNDLPEDVREYSPQALAFVGDGVFDLAIRTLVVSRGNRPVKYLHREKARIVNAHAQAQLAERLLPLLTGEEADIYRRGRNAHSRTTARNQSVADYRSATGLEALCGYLYLTGRTDRLLSLIGEVMAGKEETDGGNGNA